MMTNLSSVAILALLAHSMQHTSWLGTATFVSPRCTSACDAVLPGRVSISSILFADAKHRRSASWTAYRVGTNTQGLGLLQDLCVISSTEADHAHLHQQEISQGDSTKSDVPDWEFMSPEVRCKVWLLHDRIYVLAVYWPLPDGDEILEPCRPLFHAGPYRLRIRMSYRECAYYLLIAYPAWRAIDLILSP